MPHNIEAERAVLGALFLDPRKIGTVQAIISEDDFYKRSHQLIFNAIDVVFDRNGALDFVMVVNQLEAYDALENAGGASYLAELIEATPTAEHVEYYANIVKQKSTLRRLIAATTTISSEAYDESDSVENIVDRSEKLILSIGEGSQVNKPKEMRHLVVEAYDRVVKLSEEKRDITGLATGYHDLDKMTSGFQGDQLIIIAARPSVGKTAFALNIAQNVATKSKVPVAIFSLEMGAIDLVYRMVCAEGNIFASNMKTGQLTEDEWSSFTIATDTLKNAKIFIDDSAGIKVSEIRAKCRRLKQENPDLGLIVIDYLQLMAGSGRSDNRASELGEISRSLKALAKELQVPVIALSQLSRTVEQRTDKRPMMSDLRESGAIEQDADLIMFMYRDEYYNAETQFKGLAECIIGKHRNGPTGKVFLTFFGQFTKFENAAYVPEAAMMED